MSETTETPLWVWQGFFGPMTDAQAAYATLTIGPDLGVIVPLEGGPRPVDRSGAMGMFAVQTCPDRPMPPPAGMLEADPAMVGRMVGA